MTERKTTAEIQNLPVAELQEQLSGLTRAQLTELRALEAKETNRVTALSAIDAAIAAATEADEKAPADKLEPSTAPTTPPAEASAPAPAPQAWQQPQYTGPLDIEQMDWRRRNIKPVRQVKTK